MAMAWGRFTEKDGRSVFEIETGDNRFYELFVANEPSLLEASSGGRRAMRNFYSSRDATGGVLATDNGRGTYELPTGARERLAGQSLYFLVKSFRDREGRNPALSPVIAGLTGEAVRPPVDPKEMAMASFEAGLRLRRSESPAARVAAMSHPRPRRASRPAAQGIDADLAKGLALIAGHIRAAAVADSAMPNPTFADIAKVMSASLAHNGLGGLGANRRAIERSIVRADRALRAPSGYSRERTAPVAAVAAPAAAAAAPQLAQLLPAVLQAIPQILPALGNFITGFYKGVSDPSAVSAALATAMLANPVAQAPALTPVPAVQQVSLRSNRARELDFGITAIAGALLSALPTVLPIVLPLIGQLASSVLPQLAGALAPAQPPAPGAAAPQPAPQAPPVAAPVLQAGMTSAELCFHDDSKIAAAVILRLLLAGLTQNLRSTEGGPLRDLPSSMGSRLLALLVRQRPPSELFSGAAYDPDLSAVNLLPISSWERTVSLSDGPGEVGALLAPGRDRIEVDRGLAVRVASRQTVRIGKERDAWVFVADHPAAFDVEVSSNGEAVAPFLDIRLSDDGTARTARRRFVIRLERLPAGESRTIRVEIPPEVLASMPVDGRVSRGSFRLLVRKGQSWSGAEARCEFYVAPAAVVVFDAGEPLRPAPEIGALPALDVTIPGSAVSGGGALVWDVTIAGRSGVEKLGRQRAVERRGGTARTEIAGGLDLSAAGVADLAQRAAGSALGAETLTSLVKALETDAALRDRLGGSFRESLQVRQEQDGGPGLIVQTRFALAPAKLVQFLAINEFGNPSERVVTPIAIPIVEGIELSHAER